MSNNNTNRKNEKLQFNFMPAAPVRGKEISYNQYDSVYNG